jgi:putative ABC transport system permease protein
VSAFLRLLGYVRRTIVRARTRSLLTLGGTALAMALFAFVQSLEAGVRRLSETSNQPVLVVFETSRFCPLTSDLPIRYADEVAKMPGVASVLPTLLYINACRANLDLVTLHGVPTDGEAPLHDMELVAGDLSSWRTTSDGALVGKRLAQRRGLEPGDRLQLVDGNVQIDVRVGGVVSSTGAGLDNVAFVHLDLLQQARKKVGTVTELFVRLEPGTDPEALARSIDERFRTDQVQTDTKTLQAFVQGAVGEVAEVVGFGRLLGYLAVAVVILILANTVAISAQTRVAELATMETVGAPRALLAGLVAVESVLLALVGGIVGVGAVMAWLHFAPVTMGIEGVGIDVAPDPSLALVGAALSVLVGLVAAAGPVIGLLRRPLALAVKPV